HRVPVIIVSAKLGEADVVRALELGADDCGRDARRSKRAKRLRACGRDARSGDRARGPPARGRAAAVDQLVELVSRRSQTARCSDDRGMRLERRCRASSTDDTLEKLIQAFGPSASGVMNGNDTIAWAARYRTHHSLSERATTRVITS